MKKLTPAQQQYMDMKKQYPDCLLFFRLGDFYELFYEDAHIAHKVLGITLTSRDKNAENPIPMAGIPYHALEKYLPLLVQVGYKVAIADQVGEVIPGKLVERKITQIITPGTRVEQGSLASYLLAVVQHPNHRALAWGDVSLGVRTTTTCLTREEVLDVILRIAPREIICDGSLHDISFMERRVHEYLGVVISLIPSLKDIEQWLLHTLQVSTLAGFGSALDVGVREACASLFRYLIDIKQTLCIRRIELWQKNAYVQVDQLTIKNLEIFQGSYQGNKKQSLFGVINQCSTSMGSRLLADLLTHPTQDIQRIEYAQQQIRYRFENQQIAHACHHLLAQVSDIPRIAQQITQKKRLVYMLRQVSEQIQQLHMHELFFSLLMKQQPELVAKIDIFTKDLMVFIQQGPFDEQDRIASGQDTDVDKLRQVDSLVDEKLLAYQQDRFTRSGVGVKVKHITNQGYFLEVTPKDIKKFEASIDQTDQVRGAVRAQTLKTGQRYISSYLQELQTQIYSSKENLSAYHREKSEELYSSWTNIVQDVYIYADLLAQLDVHATMALLMHEQDWTLPTVLPDGDLEIIAGRHPVVEAFLPQEEQFIPNDTICTKENFFHIITGPNMGGKSTYMRQQALIVLLAHAGLPVPAKEAKIPLVDGLFARIGSGDLLAKQQSTFMTEMIETATILHNASHRSFLVIDELGRGTSTSDGLALAKAITVYICQNIKAKTLFATHYHQLIELEGEVAGVQNRHVGVHETDHEIVFLKKICLGGTDKSYGFDVAKLAGIPSAVLAFAEDYLRQGQTIKHKHELITQDSLFTPAEDEKSVLCNELRATYSSLDVYAMTPLDAAQILQEIVMKLRK